MKPIKKMLLHEAVVSEIIHFIQKNKLKSGDKLPAERTLAANLNVSRPIVREALKSLEADQIVTIKRGSGIYITHTEATLTTKSEVSQSQRDHLTHLKDLSLIRIMIETTAAIEARKIITKEELTELYRRENKENESLENTYQTQGQYHVNLDFEMDITAISKNPYLIDYHQQIDQLWRTHYEALNMFAFPVDMRHHDHQSILRAIESNNENQIAEAVRFHLERVMEACNSLLEI